MTTGTHYDITIIPGVIKALKEIVIGNSSSTMSNKITIYTAMLITVIMRPRVLA